MAEIQTVIWDLDGTMLDSFGVFVEVVGQIYPRYGKPVPDPEFIAANYHGSISDCFQGITEGGLSAGELAAITADFMLLQDTQYETIEGHLFEDAEALAQRAHATGIKQLMVTNRDHEGRNRASPRSIVANSELSRYIDRVICGDDSEHRKPKPEVLGDYIHIYKPETTLVIGDQFVDAEFARNLGARAVLVSRGGTQPPHMERLGDGWQDYVSIVDTLDAVAL